jgi:F-type H+-transporting ATPase subunit delta
MADTAVARRYARALLELGLEQGNLDKISSELQRFTDLLHANDEQVLGALNHPGLEPEERASFLRAVLERYPFEATVASFVKLAQDKGRVDAIPAINAELQAMADDKFNRQRAVLTTAAPISDALKDEFRKVLEASSGKTVLLDSKVDPALIGGVTIAIGDKVYDASVRSRLAEIKRSLLTARSLTPAEA